MFDCNCERDVEHKDRGFQCLILLSGKAITVALMHDMFPKHDFQNVYLREHGIFVMEAQPFMQVTVSKNKAVEFINDCER